MAKENKSRLWVVRVVIPTIENKPPLAQRIDGAFLECLRYAGVITLHADEEDRQTFDIRPPMGIAGNVSKSWASRNADRMKTFGFNAVAAPMASLEGRRVVLMPFEGEPQQAGVCCSEEPCNGTVIVRLDPKYIKPGDDGVREVPTEQCSFK